MPLRWQTSIETPAGFWEIPVEAPVHTIYCGLLKQPDKQVAASEWVRQHQNILLIGPTGIGKSWLACALAQKACRDGFSVLHKRTSELFRELAVAHVDGSFGRLLTKFSRVDVLVLDEFAMAPLKDAERRDMLEIFDDRYQRRSTVLTSQVPVPHWHEQIGDPSVADSILDRLVHNAYRIELDGESIRKKRGRKSGQEDAQ
jgi:DNA replication protein DnaC